jgi:Fic family protein
VRDYYIKRIKELKKRLDNCRPLEQEELEGLRKWYLVESTYNSNSIEGNTMTLSETKVIIEDGLTVGGHSIREILEVVNHKEASEKLADIVRLKTKLSEDLICDLHRILIKGIDDKNAGCYRQIQVFISGETKTPPLAVQVSELMCNLLDWYHENKNMDPVLLAGELHYRFVKIHPFVDGNGRIVRLLVNLILMQNEYPMVIIPVIKRNEYMDSLHSSASQEKFTDFFIETVYLSIRDYLAMISCD